MLGTKRSSRCLFFSCCGWFWVAFLTNARSLFTLYHKSGLEECSDKQWKEELDQSTNTLYLYYLYCYVVRMWVVLHCWIDRCLTERAGVNEFMGFKDMIVSGRVIAHATACLLLAFISRYILDEPSSLRTVYTYIVVYYCRFDIALGV